MAYQAGFQYLEQRDSEDNIVKEGVVSKKSAFATSDNAGIYDTIAENFRVMREAIKYALDDEGNVIPSALGGTLTINSYQADGSLLTQTYVGNENVTVDNLVTKDSIDSMYASADDLATLNSTVATNTSNISTLSTNVNGLGTAASKNVGTASGNVPVLDSNGKLSDSVLPALAITSTYTVASQTAMLALTAQEGDVAIRTDENKSYILTASPASTLSNWKELLTPTSDVTSVNGLKGAVTLTTSNITEGTNQYYTQSRFQNDFDTAIIGVSTSDLSDGDTVVHANDLATVATTGDYSDLTNIPSFSLVAQSGSYNDLSNTPDLTVYAKAATTYTKTEVDDAIAAAETQGVKGDKGDKGDTGAAATISVGTVTTGAAGSSASVTNSGTTSAAVLNFTIPQGAKGDKGDKGTTGDAGTAATIKVGTVSSGTTASVTNSGTTSAAVLNFVLPKGDKGDTGDKGDAGTAGTAATISIGTVTTGAAGTSASVTNSGTSTAAVLDFVIPKGDKGDTGASGSGSSSGSSDYTLPVATTSTLGGVKASSTLTVASDGTASVASAPKLTTARTITISNDDDDVIASASFDGSESIDLAVDKNFLHARYDGSGNVISTTYAKAANVYTKTDCDAAIATAIAAITDGDEVSY